jgi:tubulin polyglutamylase TTLL9
MLILMVSSQSDDWDIYWIDVGSMKELFDHGYFEEHMRINHFRNHYELTRKDLMVKNLKRFKRQFEKDQNKAEVAKWDFFPITFVLPVNNNKITKLLNYYPFNLFPFIFKSEYHMFVEEFKRKSGTIWIMKPAGRAQGKGIFLFTELNDIMAWKKNESKPNEKSNDPNKEIVPAEVYIVQRYLSNPYLIGGRKFDIRIYVLVMSFSPIKAYLYREGFARLSGTRFSLDSIADRCNSI